MAVMGRLVLGFLLRRSGYEGQVGGARFGG